MEFHCWVLYLFVGPLINSLPIPTPNSLDSSEIVVNIYGHGVRRQI